MSGDGGGQGSGGGGVVREDTAGDDELVMRVVRTWADGLAVRHMLLSPRPISLLSSYSPVIRR